MIGIGILGFTGRTGGAVALEILYNERCRLAAATRRDISLEYRGAGYVLFTPDPMHVITCNEVDVVIDFTSPGVTPKFARLASEVGKPFVSGTTGLNEDGIKTLHFAAEAIPVLHAPNMSASIFEFKHTVAKLTKDLASSGCVIDILEEHREGKMDRPSGTALALKQIIEANGGTVNNIQSIRERDTIGVHTVNFNSPTLSKSVRHVANDRAEFARGAIEAAVWLHKRPAGFYGMNDVFGAAEPQ